MRKNKQKRLRIFAGANGSGKSTLVSKLKKEYNETLNLDIFVNADEIEREIKINGKCSLWKYFRFKITDKELKLFITEKGMIPTKITDKNVLNKITAVNNYIKYSGEINSYISADIASFIRYKLLEKGKSFAFETVFSHESKLDFIKEANNKGYKVYLYYINTNDSSVNINNVKNRVKHGGHSVPTPVIINRYNKSIDIISKAIPLCYRSFIFSNTYDIDFIAQFDSTGSLDFSEGIIKEKLKIPFWFKKLISLLK